MGLPNKKLFTATINFDPGFLPPDDGNKATQYVLVEGSEDYTQFAIQMFPNGTAAIGAVYSSVAPGKFVPGVAGGLANNSLTPPTNYQLLFDCNVNTDIVYSAGKINLISVPVQLRGGIVVRIDTINGNGNMLHVTMGSSPFVASL